jgi:hypothetical protein
MDYIIYYTLWWWFKLFRILYVNEDGISTGDCASNKIPND